MHIVDDAELGAFNSFGIAARAGRLVRLTRRDELEQALAACGPQGPQLILGGGSNLLLTRDLPGSVLQVDIRGRTIVESDGALRLVDCAAGEIWHEFVQWTLAEGLYGLENLALIPGRVGASPIQNIGAYGVEVCEHLDSVEAVHPGSRQQRRFTAEECAFAYRDSRFKHGDGTGWLITSVRFRLSTRPMLRMEYGDIRAELSRRRVEVPTPRDVAEAVIAIRRRKLPDPARVGNAGSFFKNPTVTVEHLTELRRRDPDLPAHPAADPGRMKLPAAWLIERCGWKGHREGDAGVHPDHALVLVNYGAARGIDLLNLSVRIAESVDQRFGIRLEPEPRIL